MLFRKFSVYVRYAFFAPVLTILYLADLNAEEQAITIKSQIVADQLATAKDQHGQFISWQEHLIDDEVTNGGTPIRGGDGLAMADFDQDGHMDVISVHEDSHHLRIAYGSSELNTWTNITLASGKDVAAIEDIAVGDLNNDGWLDLVAACEDAHLIYLQNPGKEQRTAGWQSIIPAITQNRGSWIRTALADMNGDGRLEVIGANKGMADVVKLRAGEVMNNPVSQFILDGNPLKEDAWKEQVLIRIGVPNHVLPVDIDNDGDIDLLTADRKTFRMFIVENVSSDQSGQIKTQAHRIKINANESEQENWRAAANAFNAVFADINNDGRQDLLVNALEFSGVNKKQWTDMNLAWLIQPKQLDQHWQYQRVGSLLPDWAVGFNVADIDNDGDIDIMAGGYSGLNLIKATYSGASRDRDDTWVTADSSVSRLAWFENKGQADWVRHDVSRRVRGMFDGFVPIDMDADGDVDFVSTRGNSGEYDGVFWLQQVRTKLPIKVFQAAREKESKGLPLADKNWRSRYDVERVSFTAPNKAAQEEALSKGQ